MLIKSPDRGAAEKINPQNNSHLNEQEQSQLRALELKYMDIASNKDMLKQVLVDCNYSKETGQYVNKFKENPSVFDLRSNYTRILNSDLRKSIEDKSVISYSKGNRMSRNLSPTGSQVMVRSNNNSFLQPNNSIQALIQKTPGPLLKYPGLPPTNSYEKVQLNDHQKLMKDYKDRISNHQRKSPASFVIKEESKYPGFLGDRKNSIQKLHDIGGSYTVARNRS